MIPNKRQTSIKQQIKHQDTMSSEKAAAELLSEYKSNSNVELEIRFKSVTGELFESIYNSLKTSTSFKFKSIQQSLETISQNIYDNPGKFGSTNYIRKQIFDFNKQSGRLELVSNSYHQKYALARPIFVEDYIRYSIVLSKELSIPQFKVRDKATARFKNRISFVDQNEQWLIDLTATKMSVINEVGPMLNTILGEVFKPATLETFMSELNTDQLNNFEIEIEHIGDKKQLVPHDLTNIVKTLFSLINPEHTAEMQYRDEVYDVADKILKNRSLLPYYKTRFGLKQLLNQAKPLTRGDYREIYPPFGWFLTEKADGVRCVLHLSESSCKVIAHEVFTFSPKVKCGELYIAEGELLLEGGKPHTLLLFDVMIYAGKDVIEEGFVNRQALLAETAKFSQGILGDSLKVVPKQMTAITELNLSEVFAKTYEAKYPYNVDGLILLSPNDDYFNTVSYKWKPVEHNTIDFLAIKAPQKLLGIKPFLPRKDHELYLLFNGINHDIQNKLGIRLIPQYSTIFPDIFQSIGSKGISAMPTVYYPIQFSPSANPLEYLYYHKVGPAVTAPDNDINYKIVEMRKIPRCVDTIFNPSQADYTLCEGFLGPWELVRVRQDRKMEKGYYGNDFIIAEQNYQIYLNPLRLKDLAVPQSTYFMKTANDVYKPANGFRRFVISMLTQQYAANVTQLVDLGSGRGADLRRYYENGVKKGLFIDYDEEALAELIHRKFDIIKQKNKERREKQNELIMNELPFNMTVHVLKANLKDKYSDVFAQFDRFDILPGTVDVCFCNFAFHYFCENVDTLRNIIKLISKMLKIGGKFIFTTLNGERVYEKLQPLKQGDKWELVENNVVKYAIQKLYPAGEKLALGQKIAVKLPMTDELYEEPLCVLNHVAKEFKTHNFVADETKAFADSLPLFQKENRYMYEKLTEQDLVYNELYYYAVFTKQKHIKAL